MEPSKKAIEVSIESLWVNEGPGVARGSVFVKQKGTVGYYLQCLVEPSKKASEYPTHWKRRGKKPVERNMFLPTVDTSSSFFAFEGRDLYDILSQRVVSVDGVGLVFVFASWPKVRMCNRHCTCLIAAIPRVCYLRINPFSFSLLDCLSFHQCFG